MTASGPSTRRFLAGALIACILSIAGPASAEIKLKLPPPDLNGVLPLAALPLDKPAVPLPPIAPPPMDAFPELPSPPLTSDIAHRPVAPMPPARMLACNPVGTVFGVGSELLECGRARYQKGELEPARSALQNAQGSSDRAVQREARYWLGETLLRLGQPQEAERVLALVPGDEPRSDLGLFATHELGWLALGRNDPARALVHFESLLKGPMPVVLIPYARHGRALALYGLKRYAEARDEWTAMLATAGVPAPLATEAGFWLGDTQGRLGDYNDAVARLQSSAARGPRFLRDPTLLSLGWWSRAAGRPEDAVKAFRALLSASPPNPTLRPWARAGLVQALLAQNDYARAREEAKQLEAADKSSPLVIPTLLALRRHAAERSLTDEARALDTDLIARQLTPATRAWVLLLSGDLARRGPNPSEARDILELAQSTAPSEAVKQQAAYRLAQLDFDGREFAQAASEAEALLSEPSSDDLRAAAVVLAAESAYWAKDYERAASLYSRFLSDFSGRPEVGPAELALGWAEFRRGQFDAARQRWSSFASQRPKDPRAPEALLLAAELAAKAGDKAEARALFDRVASQYPGTEQAVVAGLNRALLTLDDGRPADALAELNRLGGPASSSSFAGRVRAARGLALIANNNPAQAETALRSALGQGDDGACRLGLGVIAFGRGRWDQAAREFAEARDAGWGRVATAAEYGLAAVAFNQGKLDEFKKLSEPLLAAPADPGTTPYVLQGLAAVAVEEKRWADAKSLALRVASEFPRSAAAPIVLSDVGAGAAGSGEWAVAREMYQTLASRYPSSPSLQAGRATYGEALLRTGAARDAERELQAAVAALKPNDPARARLLPLLAEAQEGTGDRAGAAQTYARFATENPGGAGATKADLGAGRLLQGEGKWPEARPFLERAMSDADAAVAAEAAFRVGEGLRAAGQHDHAVEAYMTAAYLAPNSEWSRRGLFGAARSFAALKQNDAAVIVYKKLLASSSVEPDMESAARAALKSLGN